MRRRRVYWPLPVVALLTASACAPAPGSAADGTKPGRELTRPSRPDRVPGEYILTLAPGTGAEQLSALLAPFRPDRIRDLGHGGLWLVHLREDPGLESLKRHVLKSGNVRAVQPNFRYYEMRAPFRPDRPAAN